MQDKQNKKIGKYQVTPQKLGKGNFSEVLLGYYQDTPLAVKVIPLSQLPGQDLQGLQSQVTLLRKCKNEHVVSLVDYKRTQNNFYIFLEHCEGGNLAEYIRNHQRLPEGEALRLFSQIVKGMAVINSLKIVHRDLKPANIMLKNGQAKIADFGLARRYNKGEMLKTFVGTPLSMAPEILRGRPYSDKVDVYSAGTMLYEMLFGVSPFAGRNMQEILQDIEKGQFREGQRVLVSEKVQQLLKEMLQPQPENRIDLSELLDFIQTYEAQKRQERLEEYRRQSRSTRYCFAAPGGIISPFDLSQSSSNFHERDLRLYGKLCKKLCPAEPVV